MADWLRALDFNSDVAPGSNPALATSWSYFSVEPEFNSSAMLVHSQLVCLRPFGILTCYIIIFKIFVSFTQSHNPMALNTYRV